MSAQISAADLRAIIEENIEFFADLADTYEADPDEKQAAFICSKVAERLTEGLQTAQREADSKAEAMEAARKRLAEIHAKAQELANR